MTEAEVANVKAFLATAEWEETCRGLMATVWMRDEAIDQACMPYGVRVDQIMWWRRAPNGLVPIRLVKKGGKR